MFLILLVIFAFLDPDPDLEPGSTELIESGFNPDPDPKPCLKVLKFISNLHSADVFDGFTTAAEIFPLKPNFMCRWPESLEVS